MKQQKVFIENSRKFFHLTNLFQDQVLQPQTANIHRSKSNSSVIDINSSVNHNKSPQTKQVSISDIITAVHGCFSPLFSGLFYYHTQTFIDLESVEGRESFWTFFVNFYDPLEEQINKFFLCLLSIFNSPFANELVTNKQILEYFSQMVDFYEKVGIPYYVQLNQKYFELRRFENMKLFDDFPNSPKETNINNFNNANSNTNDNNNENENEETKPLPVRRKKEIGTGSSLINLFNLLLSLISRTCKSPESLMVLISTNCHKRFLNILLVKNFMMNNQLPTIEILEILKTMCTSVSPTDTFSKPYVNPATFFQLFERMVTYFSQGIQFIPKHDQINSHIFFMTHQFFGYINLVSFGGTGQNNVSGNDGSEEYIRFLSEEQIFLKILEFSKQILAQAPLVGSDLLWLLKNLISQSDNQTIQTPLQIFLANGGVEMLMKIVVDITVQKISENDLHGLTNQYLEEVADLLEENGSKTEQKKKKPKTRVVKRHAFVDPTSNGNILTLRLLNPVFDIFAFLSDTVGQAAHSLILNYTHEEIENDEIEFEDEDEDEETDDEAEEKNGQSLQIPDSNISSSSEITSTSPFYSMVFTENGNVDQSQQQQQQKEENENEDEIKFGFGLGAILDSLKFLTEDLKVSQKFQLAFSTVFAIIHLIYNIIGSNSETIRAFNENDGVAILENTKKTILRHLSSKNNKINDNNFSTKATVILQVIDTLLGFLSKPNTDPIEKGQNESFDEQNSIDSKINKPITIQMQIDVQNNDTEEELVAGAHEYEFSNIKTPPISPHHENRRTKTPKTAAENGITDSVSLLLDEKKDDSKVERELTFLREEIRETRTEVSEMRQLLTKILELVRK